MVSAHELDASVSYVLVRVFGTDEVIVLDLQPVLFPGTGLGNHMEKRQMTV